MNRNLAILLAVILLALALTPAFGAESETRLSALIDTGTELLFDTSNVTITGKAEFRYDGDRFKTAEIRYVQSDYNSFWQEKLFTPREYSSDRETGFTVIANDSDIYVMEPYTPGAYREGYDDPQRTIIHESLESRLLVSFLKTAAKLAEPEIAKYITSNDGGWTLTLTKEQTPEILNEVLLMGGRFVAKRLFNVDYDVGLYDRSDWSITSTTREIIFMTESCAVNEASVDFRFDDQGRLSVLSGRALVDLKDTDQESHELGADFELLVGDYGTSDVKRFDPDEYQVIPWREAIAKMNEMKEKAAMEMALRAPEFWKAAGFENADRFSLDRMDTDYGISYMRFLDPEDELDHWGYNIEITETGSVLYMSALPWQRYENWLEHEQPIDLEITDEMIERITGFLAQVNPEVHFSKLIAIGQYVFEDAVFLELADENYEEAELPLLFVVQVSPEWKIVHYTCIGNG